MDLWLPWWTLVKQLRPACSRFKTFLWLASALAGFTIRGDLLGVTSIVRGLGLKEFCYDRLLDFYHSPALKLTKLTHIWCALVLTFPFLLRVNGRILLVGDGLKVPKSGKKMPAVKKLYQTSESNTKPPFFMGHSFQAVGILAGALRTVCAIPLVSRIQEGLVYSNRDKRTLLDKMILLINCLGITEKFYFIADAYYAGRKMIRGLLDQDNHLITRVRSNSVAYFPAKTPTKKKRGRPRKYGKKVHLRSLAKKTEALQVAQSPLYGEKNVEIQFRYLDLLWRSVGILVRFVVVVHPHRGTIILLCTDLDLEPLEIIRLYGLRFKIEVSFKQSIQTLGGYAYHFWMKNMIPLRRSGKNQHLHKTSADYRKAVKRKMNAYHRFVQIAIIAQGLLQYLSLAYPKRVWRHFGSWLRTIRPGICPSELVVSVAMRNTFPEFLADSSQAPTFKIFLYDRIDLDRMEGIRLVA